MTSTFDRYLTVAEEKLLFKTVAQYADTLARRDHQWMIVLRQTGIRIQAFSKLTVHDAQQAIRSKHLTLEPEIQKRKQGHTVYCTDKCRAALRGLLAIRREQGQADVPDAPLVLSRNYASTGKGMSVRSYQTRLKHWCQVAGLEVDATPHWFRHTLAKRMVATSESADPLGVVQASLGHRSRNSTAIYAAPDRETVRDAMEAAA